jgi:hypothetical protein
MKTALLVLLLAAPALAEESAPRPLDSSVGVFTALNLGLFGVDVHQGKFYGFAAGNLGIPLISNGAMGAFTLGAGYSLQLSENEGSGWYLDVFGELAPGWVQYVVYDAPTQGSGYLGIGVGVGFRYLHKSGLTLGLKVPLFGIAAGGGSASTSVLTYYEANLIALPALSIGIRF